VKSTNDEKDVAKIYGIDPKTLNRWLEKGLKKIKVSIITFNNNN